MSSKITVEVEETIHEEFNKGHAVSLEGEDIAIYPVDLTVDQFNDIIGSLLGLTARENL